MSRRASLCSRTRGFTLIELLIVISVIALLVGLLLPAIGHARTSARVAVGLSNMKQHAVATGSYSASNKDRLPHAPEGTSKSWSDPRGIRGRPALTWAVETNPSNGWAFPIGGGVDAGLDSFKHVNPRVGTSGFVFDPNLSHSSMFDFYLPALGPYIVEGEGIAMLNDVLLSASDGRAIRAWSKWRKLVRQNDGKLLHPQRREMQDITVGSYRYSPSLLVSTASLSIAQGKNSRFERMRRYEALAASQSAAWPYEHLVYNQAAAVAHPDSKVGFFLWEASHDRGAWFWCQAKAKRVPVSLLDGSARVTEPAYECLRGACLFNEGPVFNFNGRTRALPEGPNFKPDCNPMMELGDGMAGRGICRGCALPQWGWPAHFYMTWGGVRGRDL